MERHELITEIMKLTGHHRSIHPDVKNGIQRLIKKYEQSHKSGQVDALVMWRKVEDELPPMENAQYSYRILIYGKRVGIVNAHLGIYSATGRFLSYGEDVDATHWMPLPELPKAT